MSLFFRVQLGNLQAFLHLAIVLGLHIFQPIPIAKIVTKMMLCLSFTSFLTTIKIGLCTMSLIPSVKRFSSMCQQVKDNRDCSESFYAALWWWPGSNPISITASEAENVLIRSFYKGDKKGWNQEKNLLKSQVPYT